MMLKLTTHKKTALLAEIQHLLWLDDRRKSGNYARGNGHKSLPRLADQCPIDEDTLHRLTSPIECVVKEESVVKVLRYLRATEDEIDAMLEVLR